MYFRRSRQAGRLKSDPPPRRVVICPTKQPRYKLNIVFIETDFTSLKSSLVEHCQQWQSKLTGLLDVLRHGKLGMILSSVGTNLMELKGT